MNNPVETLTKMYEKLDLPVDLWSVRALEKHLGVESIYFMHFGILPFFLFVCDGCCHATTGPGPNITIFGIKYFSTGSPAISAELPTFMQNSIKVGPLGRNGWITY